MKMFVRVRSTRYFQLLKRFCTAPESKRVDITSGRQQYMFDTHAVIKALENAGMTGQQAEIVMNLLVQVSQTNVDYNNRNMVTKSQQEIAIQQLMSHIAAVRKDMIILEKSEFSQLKHEYQKQNMELTQLRSNLIDELAKLRANITLDLNLEKSRSKEANDDNSKEIVQLHHQLNIKISELHSDISRLDAKIGKETANLLATYERYRNDVIRYAAGTVISCLTVALGFYRLWSN